MTFAQLSKSETFAALLHNPTWQKIIVWLHNNAAQITDGEYEIDGRNSYAIVSTVDTLPVEQCIFESHKKYIDLHYCISGGEQIAYSPISELKAKTEYNQEKDYLLYESTTQGETLTMTPDSFAIFLPEDAHMPKINNGVNKQVRKIVVKIALEAVR